jgi:filamentous hemagglutinin family protein
MQRLQSISTLLCLTASFCVFQERSATAQIIPDNSLGSESSVVVPNININGLDSDRIDGGAIRGSNLFHSFQEFNIDNGRGAYFSNPETISNILTRVTGSNISNIFGTLGVLGNANLFLINPNGIVFGPNARLDVGGSFFASTADSILFENSIEFAASNPEAPPLLTINIPIGLNFRENPGTIVNQSIAVDSEDNLVGLQVLPEKTLGLVGGNIQLANSVLTASQGRIELGSVAGNNTVSLTPIEKGYALGYENVPNFQDIALSQEALVDVQGEGGGDIQIQGRRVTLAEGSTIEATTFGSVAGGLLSIQASESVEVIDSDIFATLNSNATGNAGNLTIDTQNVLVQGGSQISTATFGNGDGGNLTVTATDIELIGDSRLFATVAPEAIGNAGNLTLNTQRLRVHDGAQISASTFGNGNGGNLTITATDVELVGTSANGQIGSALGARVELGATGNGGSLTIDTQNLRVQDGAFISTATFGNGNGGDLTITAMDIELLGNSRLFATVAPGAQGNAGNLTIDTQNLQVRDGAQILASTFGNGDAGNLTITATDVELVGTRSALATSLETGAVGNGGTLTINTQSLQVQDGAQILAGTSGNGNGGSLIIIATDIALIGTSADAQFPSSLGARVQAGAVGNGGTLTINTQSLQVQDGAQIATTTFGNGDPGNLTITATDIEITGTSADGEFISALGTSIEPGATGNGGSLTIDTQRLRVKDGANIFTSTFGNGDAGDLTVTATDIELIGTSADGEFVSGLATSVQSRAVGNGGTLTINTQRLLVRDGAQVTTLTFGNGDAGDLTVNATDIELTDTELIGTSADGQLFSALTASVRPEAVGNGGTLTINTQRLRVRDGAQIGAETFGNGDAGDLIVNATDIELMGTSSQAPSGLFTSAEPESRGQGGKLTVNTDNLVIRDGAVIGVRSESTEAAGDLIINAPNIVLDNQASLNGETTAGEGDIILNTSDLRLRNNSSITTNATGEATGGNITINTETLTAIENSDISANAEDAFGGRVTINAVGVFGTAFRTQQSQFSDITATSELGPEFSGTVELNTELDPSSGLIDLTQTVTDPSDLIAAEFCRQRGSSAFVVTGRGGIAVSPNDKSDGNQINVDLVEPVLTQPQETSQKPAEINNNPAISSLDIVPARGWIRDENGDVILVSYDPTKTGANRQQRQFPQCQPEVND